MNLNPELEGSFHLPNKRALSKNFLSQMDRYQRVEKLKAETPIDENEIRITSQGRMRSYISYARTLLELKRIHSRNTQLGWTRQKNSELKKSAEHVHTLEEKLRGPFEENTKLKVKVKEDEKLWQGLESKFSLTKTYCDQLNRTLTVLPGEVQDAEKNKLLIQEKLAVNSAALDKLNYQFNHLSLKF